MADPPPDCQDPDAWFRDVQLSWRGDGKFFATSHATLKDGWVLGWEGFSKRGAQMGCEVEGRIDSLHGCGCHGSCNGSWVQAFPWNGHWPSSEGLHEGGGRNHSCCQLENYRSQCCFAVQLSRVEHILFPCKGLELQVCLMCCRCLWKVESTTLPCCPHPQGISSLTSALTSKNKGCTLLPLQDPSACDASVGPHIRQPTALHLRGCAGPAARAGLAAQRPPPVYGAAARPGHTPTAPAASLLCQQCIKQ